MKTARFALLLMSLVLVAACGTKGPLVMPDKAAPAGSGEASDSAPSGEADEAPAPPETPAAP